MCMLPSSWRCPEDERASTTGHPAWVLRIRHLFSHITLCFPVFPPGLYASLMSNPSKHHNKTSSELGLLHKCWGIKTCCSLTRGVKHIFGLVLCAWACDGHTVRTRQIESAGWREKDEFHAPLGVFFWPSQSSSERLLKRYNLALHSKYSYSPRWSVLLNLCTHPGGRPNKFSTHTQPASFKFRAVKF